jgi:predicted nucleotidyltransferase
MTETERESNTAAKRGRVSEQQLDQIVRRLITALAPRRIYLFGSHLYGEPHAESDIDLMIVVADDAPNRYELSGRAYSVLGQVDVPVELHFARVAQFERFSTVVGSLHREVKQRGRILYAA